MMYRPGIAAAFAVIISAALVSGAATGALASEFVPTSAQPTVFEQFTDFIVRERTGLLSGLILLSGVVGGQQLIQRAWQEFWRVPLGDWTLRWSLKIVLIAFTLAATAFVFRSETKAIATAGLSPPEVACRPAREGVTTAVVLLHGWYSGADTAWNNFPRITCEDKTLSDIDLFVVDYPTFLTRRQLSIAELGRWLRLSFFSDTLRQYSEIHIIAHSMGGPIARHMYLADMLAGDSRIRSIITIGSPFLGAQLAELARALGISADLTADMAPRSEFLKALANNWTDVRRRPPTYCFTSPQDAVVPSESAKSQCECTHDYPQWGHIDMVKPALAADERYRMPIRALKNIRMAAQSDPAARPGCFGLADVDESTRHASR